MWNWKRSHDYSFEDGRKLISDELVVKLIQQEMEEESRNKTCKFLIDGFPSSEENRIGFDNIMKTEPEFVLYFDCSEEIMVKRLLILKRNSIALEYSLSLCPQISRKTHWKF